MKWALAASGIAAVAANTAPAIARARIRAEKGNAKFIGNVLSKIER
jgi:hypothetical protein